MAANRWAPWVRLSTPSVLLPYTVTSWVVHSEEGMHPWAQLTLRYQMSPGFQVAAGHLPPSLWWAEDEPVQVDWGSAPGTQETWIGYVVSPELILDPTTQQQPLVLGQMLDVRYTLLGATKGLQSAVTQTWRQCTVAYMAQTIAARHGLLAVTDPHTRAFDVRTQAGCSDFRWLQERAAEVGYRLAVDGTTLYLTDPRRPLVSSSPVLRQSRTPGMADSMQAFSAVVGETDPAGAIRSQHTAIAVSARAVVSQAQAQAPRTDPVSGASIAPQVSQLVQSYIAQSHSDATEITAAAALADVWWVHASATTDGDVRLRAGCPVTLTGTAVTPQYSGTWMVRSAHHRLVVSQLQDRLSTYYVDLTLGRDQPDHLTLGPYQAPPATASVLAAGQWTSARSTP